MSMARQNIMMPMAIAGAPPAGLAVVQSTKGLASGAGSCTTSGITTTTGNTILLACIHENGKTITFSDNKGNTYTNIGTEQAEAGGASISWAYKQAATGGAGHTFTATSTGTDYYVLIPVEISGVVATPLDKNLQTNVVGAQPYGSTLPTGTLAQANEICFFLIGSPFTGPYADANNTLLQQESNNSLYYTGGLSYKIVSATTSIAASWTLGGASSCALKTCSFKG